MMKLFIIAHVPDDLQKPLLQHIRDFDTKNPGCHFEIGMEGPDEPLTDMLERLQMNPGLTFTKIFERAKSAAERAKQRPANYDQLSPQEQWQIDKNLGILDWDGSIEPTEADQQAARDAMERAVERFKQNRPEPGSLGALGLMVEESAVEIARARAGNPEIDARIEHAIGSEPESFAALGRKDAREYDLVRGIIWLLPDDREAGLRILNSARALVMRFKR